MRHSSGRVLPFLVSVLLLALPLAAQEQSSSTTRPVLDVPYVPTPQEVVDKMLQMADVKSGDVVYDLGCGDGRIVITAAQRHGARGVGIDIDPERITEARANARQAGVTDKVAFRTQDLFKTDIRDATVVTLYLLPEVNLRLKPKLQKELKPGTRIVSHSFSMGDEWPPEKTEHVMGSTLYYWTIK
jgi:ubiquinone/menaquinone biosynthesis C-methylase UbiE